MKKITTLLLTLVFLLVTVNLPAGDNSAQGSLDGLGAALITVTLVAAIAVAALGLLTTLVIAKKSKKGEKEQLAALLFEAGSNSALKPGVNVLARLYNLTPQQVEREIVLLAGAGDFDLEKNLADDESAAIALQALNQALENRSLALGQYHCAPLHRLRNHFEAKSENDRIHEPDLNTIYSMLLAAE